MLKDFRSKLFILIFVTLNLIIFPIQNEAIALFDAGSLTTQVPNTINSAINKATSYANKIVKKTLQIYKSVQDFFKGLFSKKDTKIPGTKQIVESKVIDISNEEEIREIFPELFFRYPSKNINIQNAYKHKGQEFYEDTMIEAFTAVREMEKQLLKLDMEIVRVENEYTKAEDMNTGLYNRYMISQSTDQVMALIQELVAIKAQMTAAFAVKGEVEPLYYPEEAEPGEK